MSAVADAEVEAFREGGWLLFGAYFQGQTKACHAFQVVINLPCEPADGFKVHRPLVVPARTLPSQLL